jgi:hypothetical protein
MQGTGRSKLAMLSQNDEPGTRKYLSLSESTCQERQFQAAT